MDKQEHSDYKPLSGRKQLRVISQMAALQRAMAAERELIGIVAAYIARLRHVPVKYMAARQLWEWAGHVDALRGRIGEVPGGKPDAPLGPAVAGVWEEMLFAADEGPFLQALYSVVLPSLRDAYAEYLGKTRELPDRPSVVIVEDIVRKLNEQLQAAAGLMRELGIADAPEWVGHMRVLLYAAGGAGGSGGEESGKEVERLRKYTGMPYTAPVTQHRVAGTHCNYLFPIEGFDPKDLLKTNVDLDRVSLGIWLFCEMDAVEYISSVLYEVKGMPWEFYYDVARHVWDEARHSEFGYRLLRLLGFRAEEFEAYVGTYMMSMSLKPHERYLAVTHWYEPGSFQLKPDFQQRLAAEIGDNDGAVELLKFDLADETFHVRLGKKWGRALLDHAGDNRSVEECVEEIRQRGQATHDAQAAVFVRTMPMEQRLTKQRIAERLKQWEEQRGSRLVVLEG